MIELVAFLESTSGCCVKLSEVLNRVVVPLGSSTQVVEVWGEPGELNLDPRHRHILQVSPRVFPTVIAFKDTVPRLGWEGFAAIAPEDIQDAIVIDVLNQAAALDNRDETEAEAT